MKIWYRAVKSWQISEMSKEQKEDATWEYLLSSKMGQRKMSEFSPFSVILGVRLQEPFYTRLFIVKDKKDCI